VHVEVARVSEEGLSVVGLLEVGLSRKVSLSGKVNLSEKVVLVLLAVEAGAVKEGSGFLPSRQMMLW
jgi:hypothetical protein